VKLILAESTHRPSAEWRPAAEKRDLNVVATVQELIEHENAGDPVACQICIRSSLRSLRDRLVVVGHPVCARTVGRVPEGSGLRAARFLVAWMLVLAEFCAA
jgi:hypothetical protein